MSRALVFLCFLGLACSVSDQGHAPPVDQFFFPTGVVANPYGRWLYVTNGNTDLRFSGGSVVSVDFDTALALFASGGCSSRDPLDTRIPVCLGSDTDAHDGSRRVIDPARTLRIGSFAGQPVVQRFLAARGGGSVGMRRCPIVPAASAAACQMARACNPQTDGPNCIPTFDPDPSPGFRLLITVRGDPSMTWINVKGAGAEEGALDCGQGTSGPVPSCDSKHRLTTLASDPAQILVPEPFEIAVSEHMAIALAAHLYRASASLYALGDGPDIQPSVVDQRSGLFDPASSGALGAYGVALRPIDPANLPAVCEGQPGGICTLGDFSFLFVTSRFSPRVAQVLARGADLCRPDLGFDPCRASSYAMSILSSGQLRLESFFIDGGDVRDIKFIRDGTRAFLVDRRPPSVLELDTSPAPPPAGDPRNAVLRAVEVCEEPSLLALREDPGPLRVYVSCFSAGQIYVIDPERGAVLDVIQVGRGPNAVVQIPPIMIQLPSEPAPALHTLGVVADFADNDLAVLDLTPGSPTENTVLFRIGAPRPITGQQ